MGINIGICELEAMNASCRKLKMSTVKVLMKDISGYESNADIDEYVELDDAKKIFPDWEAFLKRNRINEESDAIYMEKVKHEEDAALLRPSVKKKYTGWVKLEGLNETQKAIAMDRSLPENRLTEWDLVEFDEMNEMCAKCPMSWDKGRGCIGAFGPDNSLLPEIAKKYNCPIIASAPENSLIQKKFPASDAAALAKEVQVLTDALPVEGKLYVRRYSGPLERLGAVAELCQKENCSFYFF